MGERSLRCGIFARCMVRKDIGDMAIANPDNFNWHMNRLLFENAPDRAIAMKQAHDYFPPEMGYVKIILPEGMPMPRGDIGAAAILLEATGDCFGRCLR